ncbi:MAG: hypothetical protein AB1813_04985 [Verrucomicrobiota bacterium]
MQLLAVGRSISGVKGAPASYKISSGRGLPKFAPVGRPVSLMPAVEIKSQSGLFEDLGPVQSGLKSSPASIRENISASPVPEFPGHDEALIAARRRKFLKRLFSPKGPITTPRAMVQSELRLESVKVMRNDLSDTDFELVAAKPVPKPVVGGEVTWRRKWNGWWRIWVSVFGLRRSRT